MRGWHVAVAVIAGLVSIGCGDAVSPLAPTALGTVAASGAGGAQLAGTSAGSQLGSAVPFRGRLQGEYGEATGSFPLIHETITAVGEATHLGRYTLEIEETVNLLELSASGTFTFTAADGDTLAGSYTGHAQPGALVSIVENCVISGGTGRFLGASGQLVINRVFDPVERTTTGAFEGTISSPDAVGR
jgi:hypothetical protein